MIILTYDDSNSVFICSNSNIINYELVSNRCELVAILDRYEIGRCSGDRQHQRDDQHEGEVHGARLLQCALHCGALSAALVGHRSSEGL